MRRCRAAMEAILLPACLEVMFFPSLPLFGSLYESSGAGMIKEVPAGTSFDAWFI
jgi:hypothetical protein